MIRIKLFESDLLMWIIALSDYKQADVVVAFNTRSRYLDDIF